MQTSAFCSVYHFTCAYLWLAVDTLHNVAKYRHFVVCIRIWDASVKSLESSHHTSKKISIFFGGIECQSTFNGYAFNLRISLHTPDTDTCRKVQKSAFCRVYRHFTCAYIWLAVGIEGRGNIRTYPCIHSDADIFSISSRELHGDIFLSNHFRPNSILPITTGLDVNPHLINMH